MNNLKETSGERIAEQAAGWFSRNREGELSEVQIQRFAQWLAESPVHIREYLGVTEIWGALQGAQDWPGESAEELLEAMRATQPGNVVVLKDNRPVSTPAQRSKMPDARKVKFAVAAGALLALGASWFWAGANQNDYQTDRGEQRSVVLADGSIVQLNTLTKMIVRFDAGHRRIELPEGEAFFRVARDSNRPFEVETPFARVRAVGTEFNVYNRAASTRIVVVEGRVQVAASNDSLTKPLALEAKQSVDVGAKGKIDAVIRSRTVPAAEPETAWIQRRIVFDNTPLDDAVAEFNRYNKQQMQVNGADLAALRISGVFSADDPRALMKYLEQVQNVEMRPDGRRFVLQRNP